MKNENNKKAKCCFSTDITEELSCSKDGEFDNYGFPINICDEFPCKKYQELLQKLKDGCKKD